MDFAELIGSAHAMELLFLFPAGLENIIVKNLVIKDQESVTKLSDQMMSYWAEFAYSGSPGKGRSNDLPEWTAWSDQDKYMILDSELDQGLIMSGDEITTSSIVSNLGKDTRLTLVEKCESLFALTYGEDLPQETFDGFSDGYCLSLDYSELLKRIENRGDNDDQES
jgi:para-nitrobenzyl esterase